MRRQIIQGNALVGPEIYDSLDESDDVEVIRTLYAPLDWNERLPERFDLIMGNPPYLKEANHRAIFDVLRRSKLQDYYTAKMDIWYAFSALAIDRLKPNGRHTFIVQDNWLTAQSAQVLRQKIRQETTMVEMVDFADALIFSGAGIQT